MRQWVGNVTDKLIHDEFVKWLRSATGLLFIKDRQAGVLPELPYGVATLTGVAEVRERPQSIEYTDQVTTMLAAPVIETEWQFSLHVFGEDPTTYLRKLRANFHITQANEPLLPNLILHEISQIRNIPDFVNEAWEPTAQMDVHIRGLTRDGVLIDSIEQIKINVTRANP